VNDERAKLREEQVAKRKEFNQAIDRLLIMLVRSGAEAYPNCQGVELDIEKAIYADIRTVSEAAKANRLIYYVNVCECGKVLHSINEVQKAKCASCWVASLNPETKAALDSLVRSAFASTSEDQKKLAATEAVRLLKDEEKRLI
jgi:hypothetical protein